MTNYQGDEQKIINRWKEQIIFFRTNCLSSLPIINQFSVDKEIVRMKE